MEAEAQIGNMMQDYIALQDYIIPQDYIALQDQITPQDYTAPQLSLLFPMIKVHRTWDVEFMKQLELLNAPRLLHLFMDLANATWSHMFTSLITCRITVEVCKKIIDDMYLQQLFINLECSGIEEGVPISKTALFPPQVLTCHMSNSVSILKPSM